MSMHNVCEIEPNVVQLRELGHTTRKWGSLDTQKGREIYEKALGKDFLMHKFALGLKLGEDLPDAQNVVS